MVQSVVIVVSLWYATVSAAALAVFAWDKRAAARGAWRVPESRLHLLSAAGGWPGSIAAIALLRHKNRKPLFIVVTVSIAAIHLILIGAVLAVTLGNRG